MADLVNLAQVVFDVVLAQQGDVQPEMLSEPRLHAFAFGDVLFHAPRDDVARRQLLFLRLVVGHEAMAVDVLQQPAIAARALGQKNACRKSRRRMKLHRLHIAEGGNAGLQGDGGGNAFGDNRIRRHAVEPPRAAAGNRSGFGDVSCQFTGNKISHDRAVTTAAIVDQSNRFGSLVHRDAIGNRLIAHGEQHRVARAVGHVTGAPLVGAAEGALRD